MLATTCFFINILHWQIAFIPAAYILQHRFFTSEDMPVIIQHS